jgi:uncharacterized DUF497 family protein
MDFEFDPTKSKANKIKHGIDFVEAQALWYDESLIFFPARERNELRYIAVAILEEKYWSTVFVRRGPNIRLISVRRSRKQEIKLYESK